MGRVKALEDSLGQMQNSYEGIKGHVDGLLELGIGDRLQGCEDEVHVLQAERRKLSEELGAVRMDHATLKGYVDQMGKRFEQDKAEVHKRFIEVQKELDKNAAAARDLE